MQFQFPTSSVPNVQAYPNNAYPASGYYGINSSLEAFDTFGASAGAANASGSTSLMPSQTHISGLMTAFVIVIIAVVAWHFYYK